MFVSVKMWMPVCGGQGPVSGVILSLSPLHYNYMDTRVSVCGRTQMNIGAIGDHHIPLELELGWL